MQRRGERAIEKIEDKMGLFDVLVYCEIDYILLSCFQEYSSYHGGRNATPFRRKERNVLFKHALNFTSWYMSSDIW